MKKYRCIAKCVELDDGKEEHCICTEKQINARWENSNSDCPCGNRTNWVEIKDVEE